MISTFMLTGFAALIVLLYASAVYALAIVVGLWVGLWALQAGAGGASLVLGVMAAVLVLRICRRTVCRSPIARGAFLVAIALPAMIAGYSLVLGLAELGHTPSPWSHLLALMGACSISATAVEWLGSAGPSAAARGPDQDMDGAPRCRPSVHEMLSPRSMPETALPRLCSSTGRRGTRLNALPRSIRA